MIRTVALLTVLLAIATAAAQDGGIQWITEPRAAVAQAQRTNHPLMVYVLPSTKDRDKRIERAQIESLRDPRVLRAAQSFVPLKLSRSVHRDELSEFGLSGSSSMEMSFVSPDGEVLDTLSAGGVSNARSLAQKLRGAMQLYGGKLYEKQVKPVFKNESAKTSEIKTALELIADFNIVAAEEELIELLDRPRLSKSLLRPAYNALAALSTPGSVTKLVELSREGQKHAQKALTNCTIAGAGLLLAELGEDVAPKDYPIYKAIAEICQVPKPKSTGWFENAKPEMQKEELERVAGIVLAAIAASES